MATAAACVAVAVAYDKVGFAYIDAMHFALQMSSPVVVALALRAGLLDQLAPRWYLVGAALPVVVAVAGPVAALAAAVVAVVTVWFTQGLRRAVIAVPGGAAMAVLVALNTTGSGLWLWLPIALLVWRTNRLDLADIRWRRGPSTAEVATAMASVLVLVVTLMVIASPGPKGGRDIATRAKTNAALAQKAIESCAAANVLGSYAGCGMSDILTLEPSLRQVPADEALRVVESSDDGYKITSTLPKMPRGPETEFTFTIARDATGTVERTCSPVHRFACPSGTW